MTAKYCATCMAEEDEDTPFIGDVCAECFKKMKGDDSVTTSPTGQVIPNFETYEEMEKFLAGFNKKTTEKTSTPKKSSSRKKGREPKDPSVADSTPDGSVWRTQHFYTREGDTFEATLKDAREERKFRNENVLIFVHEHIYGKDCTERCKESVSK